MSELSVFQLVKGKSTRLDKKTASVEKDLQTLMEQNLEDLLGVRFLATEYSTGAVHRGIIDTLGIDENDCPVIIEYKRNQNANVINQGLFYLDWLLDHRNEFQDLVRKKFGSIVAEQVNWKNPRLVCVASDYSRYDIHAVNQINRNIDLFKYGYYGDNLFALDLVNTRQQDSQGVAETTGTAPIQRGKEDVKYKTFKEFRDEAEPNLRAVYDALVDFIEGLDDEVTSIEQKFYHAFKRVKNFACIEIRPQKGLVVYLKVAYATIPKEHPAFKLLRDMTNIGHFGTGDLEVTIHSVNEIELVKDLVRASYDAN